MNITLKEPIVPAPFAVESYRDGEFTLRLGRHDETHVSVALGAREATEIAQALFAVVGFGMPQQGPHFADHPELQFAQVGETESEHVLRVLTALGFENVGVCYVVQWCSPGHPTKWFDWVPTGDDINRYATMSGAMQGSNIAAACGRWGTNNVRVVKHVSIDFKE
jgi:hypothetical protein